MTTRILTLAEPDARHFYAVCDDCGFLSVPFPERDLAWQAATRHVCRMVGVAERGTMTAS